MPVDLNDIWVFVEVVEAGSFTAAARKLGLPKSSVSRRVSRLEDRLGVRLLQRTTRSLHLTEVGQRYHAQASRLLRELFEAERQIESQGEGPRGRLRISAPSELAENFLGQLGARFLELHPEMQLEVMVTDRSVDLVEEGVDLALRTGTVGRSANVARRLFNLDLLLVASPSYLAQRPVGDDVTELEHHDVLLLSNQDEAVWTLSDGEESKCVPVRARMSANHMGTVYEAALSGAGIALLPRTAVEPEIDSGRLVRVLPAWRSPGGSLWAVYPSRRHLAPKVRAFLDFLVALEPAEATAETPNGTADAAGAEAAGSTP